MTQVAAAPEKESAHTRGHLVVSEASQSFGDVQVLDRVSFRVPLHGRLALLGPSGSGKSTLLSRIAGLRDVSQGEITIGEGKTAADRLEQCALMPQKDLLLPWRTALDNACISLENAGVSKKEARERVRPLFKRAGLADFVDRHPYELSGGMRQRVAFLRTLVADKEVLLLDEPFAALDSLTRADMQQWLLNVMAEEPRTLVLVTHDVEEALLLANQVLVLSTRPARVISEIDAEYPVLDTRRATIATPEFVALRDQALEALEC